MSHYEEGKISLTSSRQKKKKGKVVKAIYKLLTLGGLLVIIFKALQKQKGSQDK